MHDNAVVWFEIPVHDFDRAAGFYETVLDTRLHREDTGPFQMGIFPAKDKAHGCIISGEGCRPGREGTMVYVNAGRKLRQALKRVREAGGEILQDTTLLPNDMGMYAIIRDTEGNRVGLHAA
jgi:predicted enzyme related to lactoylglutathione lyase